MGLAIMVIWTHARLIDAPGRPRDRAPYFILLACLTSALLLTYQHMLPFVWVFAAVYSVVLALRRKTTRPLWISAIGHLVACAVAAALSPHRAIIFLQFFKYIGAVQAGWSMPFFSPDYVVGLSYQNSPFTIEDSRIHLIAATSVSAIAFLWLLIAFKNARKRTVAIWIGCAVIYAGGIVLALRGEDGQVGGYKSFKMVVFFLPFFAASLASLFDIVPISGKRLALGLKILMLVSLAIGYVRADIRLLDAMRIGGKWVQPQYQALLTVDRDNKVESVNVLGQDGWENMWAAYFLMHKKLYFEYASYYPPSRLEGEYDLQDSRVNAPIRHLPAARVPGIRRLNDRFYLIGPIPEQ
jgi:hypothetical protein